MASQYFTIIKIGGDAAKFLRRRWQTWHAARVTDDPCTWCSSQWPPETRQEIDALADQLRRQSHESPILFFVEFVDLWSSSPDMELELPCVMGDRYEAFLMDLPIDGDFKRRLRHQSRHKQTFEDRFFAKMLLAAETAWKALAPDALVLVLRQPFGSLATDDEIMAGMERVPDWLTSLDVNSESPFPPFGPRLN